MLAPLLGLAFLFLHNSLDTFTTHGKSEVFGSFFPVHINTYIICMVDEHNMTCCQSNNQVSNLM